MRILVTGGFGAVGSNYAAHCLRRKDDVVIIDNGDRGDSTRWNRHWLFSMGNRPSTGQICDVNGSVADPDAVDAALSYYDGIDAVVHCAAQSSVDVSIIDPGKDFISNVIGTFTVLEALRTKAPDARFIFMASNKVYDVTQWPTERCGSRYEFVGRSVGPSENFPFYTDAREPYGASKICGLYYTRCYATMYGMPTVVCVPSGMAGPRQFGKSEQGWLGWFVIATFLGLPITIKGDGCQVRDMLHVDDVCTAIDLLIDRAPEYKGELFNLGGGIDNSVSLKQALDLIRNYLGITPIIEYDDWRSQDNKVYISNIDRMRSLGWNPSIGISTGIARMCDWVKSESILLHKLYM